MQIAEISEYVKEETLTPMDKDKLLCSIIRIGKEAGHRPEDIRKALLPIINKMEEFTEDWLDTNISQSYEGQDDGDPFQDCKEILIKAGVDDEDKADEIISTLRESVFDSEVLVCEMGDYLHAIVDKTRGLTLRREVKLVNGRDYSRDKRILTVAPMKVTIYDSPLPDEPRRFRITFKSMSGKQFSLGPDLLPNIIESLNDQGYCIHSNTAREVIPAVLNEYEVMGLAEVKDEVDYPGFYYNARTDKVPAVKWEPKGVDPERLKRSIEVLDSFGGYYDGVKDKLATVMKWGLLAPFSYAMKQRGNWMEWLYLYGAAGSGKTTMAWIPLYLYLDDKMMKEQEVGGGNIDTPARLGNILRRTTFPTIVNEPGGALNKPSVVEMIKTSVQGTVSRGKYVRRSYVNIPALSPIVFTSNHYLPLDDALLRRMRVLRFTYNERKVDDPTRIEEFNRTFMVERPGQSPLRALREMGAFVYREISENPDLLDEDWTETADHLLKLMDADLQEVGGEIPSWLWGWNESNPLQAYDEDHREKVRITIVEAVNRHARGVRWRDEDDAPVGDHATLFTENYEEFGERVRNVLQANLIPWMIMVGDKVGFTSGLSEELRRRDVSMDMKSLAELMGWEYTVRKIGGRSMRIILLDREELVRFLYPSSTFP